MYIYILVIQAHFEVAAGACKVCNTKSIIYNAGSKVGITKAWSNISTKVVIRRLRTGKIKRRGAYGFRGFPPN